MGQALGLEGDLGGLICMVRGVECGFVASVGRFYCLANTFAPE